MHMDKQGRSKIVHRCSMPLTGAGVVDMIITELAVFAVRKQQQQQHSFTTSPSLQQPDPQSDTLNSLNNDSGGLILLEHVAGVTVDELRKLTDAPFDVSSNLTVVKDELM